MSRRFFRLVVLTLALLAPLLRSSSAATLAWPSTESAQDVSYRFWFESRGLPPAQAEVVATGFAEMARDATRLAAAARPLEADLMVRMTLGGAAMAQSNGAPQLGGGVVGAGADPGSYQTPDATDPTIEVTLSLIDTLAGEALFERRVDCQLPLTRGSFIAANCLRSNFPRIVRRMEEWADAETAVAAMVADFGPSESDRQRLDAAGLGRAYYREAVRASRAGYEVRALDLMAEAQPRFKQTGLRSEEGAAWAHLAYLIAATYRGDERAIDYAEQTVRIARELSDAALEAQALNLLAAGEARAGDYRRAVRIARSASSKARETGDALTEGTAIAILGGLAAITGNFDQARSLQADALRVVQSTGNARAEARLRLCLATVTALDDDRMRSASLEQLGEVGDRALELGSLGLLRDVAFAKADARYGTTEFGLLTAGEVDAIRALRLSRRLDDKVGEAAAIGLLGAFALRLGKRSQGLDYLVQAQELARAAGFAEGLNDSVQLLGESSLDLEHATSLLDEVVASRVAEGDLRSQIKTLSDISRLQSAMQRGDDAWESYVRAATAVDAYVGRLREGTDQEDVRESVVTVLKSLMTTRTELPYLARYQRINRIIPLQNPNWIDG